MKLQFDAATHTYRLDGRVVPSVTQVIALLYGGAFDAVAPATLERKRRFGQALHYATELDDAGNLDEESLHPELLPYLQGWRRFRREHRVEVISVEEQLGNETLWFAGTLDRRLVIDGEAWKIDLKTTAAIHRAVGVQLAGYSLLGPAADRHGALRLCPDGTYRLVPFDNHIADDRRCFLGLLAVFNWRAKYEAPKPQRAPYERREAASA